MRALTSSGQKIFECGRLFGWPRFCERRFFAARFFRASIRFAREDPGGLTKLTASSLALESDHPKWILADDPFLGSASSLTSQMAVSAGEVRRRC